MITLLIAIHNRPGCLMRCLSYYKELNFPVRIIVLDSSTASEQLVNQQCIKNLETDSFSPLYKSFSQTCSYAEKIYKGLFFVVTPYLCLASCDDFFSKQGLIESIKFLRNNLDYAFCSGYYYGFTFEKGKIAWYYLGAIDNMRSIENSTPLERIDAYMNKMTTIFYACFRSATLKEIIKNCYRYSSNEVFFESLFVIMGLLHGKGKYLEIPYFYKELSDKSKGVELQTKWLLGKDFIKNKQLFVKGIELGLQKTLCFSSEKSNVMAIDISNRFFDNITEKTFSYPSYSVNLANRHLSYFLTQYFYIASWAIGRCKSIGYEKCVHMKKKIETRFFLFQAKTPYYKEIILIQNKIKESNIYVSHNKLDGLIRL